MIRVILGVGKGWARTTSQREIYVLLLGRWEEKRAFSAFVALLPSNQNNPYAKGTYLGVAYTDPLHTLEAHVRRTQT